MASELALIKEIDRLDKVNTTLKQKAKAGVGQAMELGSAIGGAAVAGYAQGRYGWEIAGLSTSETAAIGLVVVGLSGIAGKRYSRLLMEAAKGAGGFAVGSRAAARGMVDAANNPSKGGAVGALPRVVNMADLQASLARARAATGG